MKYEMFDKIHSLIKQNFEITDINVTSKEVDLIVKVHDYKTDIVKLIDILKDLYTDLEKEKSKISVSFSLDKGNLNVVTIRIEFQYAM